MYFYWLRRPIHVSWLIAVGCVGVVVGIVISPGMPLALFSSVAWLIAGILLVGLAIWRARLYAVVLIFLAGGSIGLWRGASVVTELRPYAQLMGYTITVKGVVEEDVEVGKNGATTIRLSVGSVDGHELGGRLWVRTYQEAEIKRSDTLTVRGEVGPGFGSFNAAMHQATLVEATRTVPGDVALQVRDWFSGQVEKVIPAPQAALGLGFLTGQQQSLTLELEEALRTVGLTHIIVASGYNLTILVRLARRTFSKISKYLATLSASGMIIGFVAITGMSPSMSRAGLIAGLSLAAWYYGRKLHPLMLLPVAAAMTLVVQPSYAWGDLGWQLSFAAFAGVMITAPLLQAYFFGAKKPGVIRQILGETISAQLWTLPILLLAFGQLSTVALVANLIVVPLIPLAMLLVFAAGVLAALVLPLGQLVGWAASALLSYMVNVAHFFASLPWALAEINTSWHVAIGMYSALITMSIYLWHATRLNLRDANLVE